MTVVLLLAGAAVVAVVMVDALLTTAAVGRPWGPLTGRAASLLWGLALRSGRHWVLESAGVLLTTAMIGTWLVLLWAGWSLIFSAHPEAVLTEGDGEPAGGWARVYYAGYTLYTLGNGEFVPGGPAWQLLAIVALLNGLGLATLGLTYLMPATSAATERRNVAAFIASLGGRPDAILLNAWERGSFGELAGHLGMLAPELSLLSQRHLAYPVLHFFYSTELQTAAAPMIARLDEAVMLLRVAVAADVTVPRSATLPLHGALTHFLDTLQSAFIEPAEEEPPLPSLRRLREAGIPVVDDTTFAERVADLAERRRLLLALVRKDARSWDDVWPADTDEEPSREEPKTREDGG